MRILGWLVAIGLLVFLANLYPQNFWDNLKKLPIESILGIALFTILANICQGMRYYFLWPEGEISIVKQSFLPFCMHSANILLPLRSGELVQPLFLRQWDPNQKMKDLFYWLMIDKFIEFICFLPFILLAAWIYHMRLNEALMLFGLGWLALIVWALGAKHKAKNLPLALLFSMCGWFFNLAVFIELIPESLKAALGMLIGTSIGSAIPGVPAGIGTYEYAFVWVGSRVGWTHDIAASLAFSSHAISIIVTLLIGIPLGLYWGWPSAEDHVEAKASLLPFRYRISNIFVFMAGALVVIFSGALWGSFMRPKKAATSDEGVVRV